MSDTLRYDTYDTNDTYRSLFLGVSYRIAHYDTIRYSSLIYIPCAAAICSFNGIGSPTRTRTHTNTFASARVHTRTHTRKYFLRRAISIYQKSVSSCFAKKIAFF